MLKSYEIKCSGCQGIFYSTNPERKHCLPCERKLTPEPTITDTEFFRLCINHDWFFNYASGRSYYNGRSQREKIIEYCNNPLRKKMFKDCKIYFTESHENQPKIEDYLTKENK
jgi:hypothetical protein